MNAYVLERESERERERSRDQELCESRGGRAGPPVPNSAYGLCIDVKQY